MTDKEKIHQILSSLWKNDDSVGKTYYNQALQDVQTAVDLQEEPVSEEFEKALAEEWKGYNERGAATVDALEDNTQELAFAKGFYRGSKWQKAKDEHLIWQISSANYEKGKQEGKELIMENATEAIVAVDAGGYPYVDKHIELYDYDKDTFSKGWRKG